MYGGTYIHTDLLVLTCIYIAAWQFEIKPHLIDA